MNAFMSQVITKRMLAFRQFSKLRITADGKDVPKIKNIAPRITVIHLDNSITITDLPNAKTISERRDLKLVKIQDVDVKTRRPIYKLMSKSEYHEEELLKRKERQESRQSSFIKGEKLVSLSSKIGEHDLMTYVNKIIKLLTKQYEVRVVIAADGGHDRTEEIYCVIEKNTKTCGRVLQKRTKGSNLKFQLQPLKEKSSDTQSTKTTKDSDDSGSSEDNKGAI